MLFTPRILVAYALAWGLLTAAGGVLLARFELAQLRDAFEVDARISHRLLSQRAVQHEAVLATLALLQPPVEAGQAQSVEQRLPSVYPQILGVWRRNALSQWPDADLEASEQVSRSKQAPAMAHVDFSAQRGHYQLVLAAQPASFALLIDVASMVPWGDWPMAVKNSPVRVSLEHEGQHFVIQPGRVDASGWRFEFRKHLASESQAFEVVAVRQVGWEELPWFFMVLWAMVVSAAMAAWLAWQRQRYARVRAEELLRVGQVTRLNTLGVLAAGMAHELNQPLTAILANTQAAKRLLQDGPEALLSAQGAMDQAVAQARRAAEVLARLRRTVEQPNPTESLHHLDLAQTAKAALLLLEPECQRHGVTPTLEAAAPVWVLAERVGLEQIVHNLVTNALQALDLVPIPERRLRIQVFQDSGGQDQPNGGRGILRISDTGPGISPEAIAHVFAPFYTTREGGLGLGLTLCETLANDMGGQLGVQPQAPRGVVFVLSLVLVTP